MTANWNWKDKDGQSGGLLYEPGNWGDVIKGAWVVRIMGAVQRLGAERGAWIYRDVFAGAPSYPLTDRTRQRLGRVGLEALAAATEGFRTEGLWPSAAAIAHAVMGPAAGISYELMDADPARAAAWRTCSWCEPVEAGNGWEAALETPVSARTLLVIDPYDCIAGMEYALPVLRAHADRCSILLYVYNRSARDREHLRQYRAFRSALDAVRRERPMLLGRVPADGFLPSAHHEMVFLPHGDAFPPPAVDALRTALEADTLRVDGAIAREGVFPEL